MILGIQIVGFVFSLFMSYLTFLYYRRGDYRFRDFGVWMVIWTIFTYVVLAPNSFGELLKPLKVSRLMDLFTIISFIAVLGIVFYLYLITRRNEDKINRIVREIALNRE
ncbi:MAG: hypothetical protein B6U97_01155 [Candidatus Altiarchaeales archaeon ex4484_96]|nr:MAG: hypothetical protein B6U97_01155 [Candidatus Altiarchaeales archaeon ex4484_96]